MSRWIKIDTSLLKTVTAGGLSAKALWRRIMQQPSIDIVRCEECELNETDDCPMVYYTPLEDGGFETRWWNRHDDFCSWGERKDDE